MRIGIDIDGILRAFQQHAVSVWNTQHPDKPFSLYDWVDHKAFYNLFPGGRAECFQWWVDNGIYSGAPILPDVCESLTKLHNRGHKIIIASQQTRVAHKDAAVLTTQWLCKNDIYFDELYFCNGKSLLPYDVLIDDTPDVISNVLKSQHMCLAIMFRWPWNYGFDFNNRRVYIAFEPYWLNTLDLMLGIERRIEDG